jgi:hypothetical protein
MTSNDKAGIRFISHKDDAVIIEVEDLAALHGSMEPYPYRWSTVKAQMIAANIFTALEGDILEGELRETGTTHWDTAASPSEVMDVIINLPRV